MIGMIFLYILLTLLIVLFIVISTVLIIPFKYYFVGEKFESTMLEGTVSWLFGGVKMRFSYLTGKGFNTRLNLLGFKLNPNNNKKSATKAENKEEDDITKKKDKPAYSYFTQEVLKKGLECILKLLNHCKPSQFQLQAKVGIDDPMYIGLLYGIKGTGFAILDKYNINLQPTFEDEVLEGSFLQGGSIRIGYLLLVAIEFVFTKPFRSILLKNNKIKIKRRLKTWRFSIATKA
jgi:hypothetical protein